MNIFTAEKRNMENSTAAGAHSLRNVVPDGCASVSATMLQNSAAKSHGITKLQFGAKKLNDHEVIGAVDYRYYNMSSRESGRYYAIACICAVALGLLFYHNIWIAAALTFVAIPCKKYYREYLAGRRRMALSSQFKDLLASLSSSFITGRQMTEALVEATTNLSLIYDDDQPIICELKYITRRLMGGRESEKEVLFDFAARSRSDDIEGFVDVYFTCLTTGGDTVRAVRRASDIIMDKLTVRNDIALATSQKKFEAKILAALPPLILVFLQLSSPDYIAPLYETALGMLVMTACLGIMGVAFIWSSKITDIEM